MFHRSKFGQFDLKKWSKSDFAKISCQFSLDVCVKNQFHVLCSKVKNLTFEVIHLIIFCSFSCCLLKSHIFKVHFLKLWYLSFGFNLQFQERNYSTHLCVNFRFSLAGLKYSHLFFSKKLKLSIAHYFVLFVLVIQWK